MLWPGLLQLLQPRPGRFDAFFPATRGVDLTLFFLRTSAAFGFAFFTMMLSF